MQMSRTSYSVFVWLTVRSLSVSLYSRVSRMWSSLRRETQKLLTLQKILNNILINYLFNYLTGSLSQKHGINTIDTDLLVGQPTDTFRLQKTAHTTGHVVT